MLGVHGVLFGVLGVLFGILGVFFLRTWCFGCRNWCLWYWDVDLLRLDFGMVQLIFSENVQICVLFSK